METQHIPAAAAGRDALPPTDGAPVTTDLEWIARRAAAAGSNYLPYIGEHGPRIYWGLSPSGGYSGGTLAGDASAMAYLKALRASPEFNCGTLQLIALDMAESLAACTSEAERESVRGQIVGFFVTIEKTIWPLTRRLRELDAVSWEELRRDVEVGLAIASEEAYATEQARRMRRDAARRGWQRRRRTA